MWTFVDLRYIYHIKYTLIVHSPLFYDCFIRVFCKYTLNIAEFSDFIATCYNYLNLCFVSITQLKVVYTNLEYHAAQFCYWTNMLWIWSMLQWKYSLCCKNHYNCSVIALVIKNVCWFDYNILWYTEAWIGHVWNHLVYL